LLRPRHAGELLHRNSVAAFRADAEFLIDLLHRGGIRFAIEDANGPVA
jgi:hypothetical protein